MSAEEAARTLALMEEAGIMPKLEAAE